MCWEALAAGTWLLVPFAKNPHNIRLVAFLPVTGRKAKIGKGCPFQVFYTKLHFLQPSVHSIIDFWSGVFNIGLLVSFLPVKGQIYIVKVKNRHFQTPIKWTKWPRGTLYHIFHINMGLNYPIEVQNQFTFFLPNTPLRDHCGGPGRMSL